MKNSIIPLNKENIKRLLKIRKKLRAVVIDSSFTNCYEMIKGIMMKRSYSKVLTSLALFPVGKSIKSATGFDSLSNNCPLKKVSIIKIPAIFMIGDTDDMINQDSFRDMFNRYPADEKKFRILVGTAHSDCREEIDINFVIKYFKCFLHSIETITPKTLEDLPKELKEKNE